MDEENGNGERGHSVVNHLKITVTDIVNFKVHVDGTFPTLDYALNMIDQARRELEAQWRLARAQLQMQTAADAQLAKSIMGRR